MKRMHLGKGKIMSREDIPFNEAASGDLVLTRVYRISDDIARTLGSHRLWRIMSDEITWKKPWEY